MLNNQKTSPIPNHETSQSSKPIFSSNLAAVLNDPRKDRTKKAYLFTKTWGSDFTESANFKIIKSELGIKNFESHINETNERLKQHHHNKNLLKNVPSNSKLNSRSLNESNSFSLEQIPQTFFDSNFDLSDRQTFELVIKSEASIRKIQKVQSPFLESPTKEFSNDANWCKLVLNKFSLYLDIIESHITKQISSKANTFFNAIHSQDEVQEHILKTSSQAKQIRQNMQTLNRESIISSIRILKLVILKIRYQKFLDKMELLSTVHQNQPAIQVHLASSEYNGALDIISVSQELLRHDLKFIRCLRHFDSQFQEIGKVIEKMINQDFIKYLNGELSRDVEEKCQIKDENELYSLVSSLMKIKSYDFIDLSREEIDLYVKSIFKIKLIEKISQLDNDEEISMLNSDTNNHELIEKVKSLRFDQFLEIIEIVLKNFEIIICRVELIVNFMLDVFRQNKSYEKESNKEIVGQNGWFKIEDKLNDLLNKTIDFVQEMLITVLDPKFKEENSDKISIHSFSSFLKLIDTFLIKIDNELKNKTATLRSWQQNQTSKFLNKIHSELKDKLVLSIDSESWKIVEPPSDFKNIIDTLCENFFNHPSNLVCRISNESGSNFLYINEEKHIIFGIVLTLIKITVEYVQLCFLTPAFYYEVSNRIVEIYNIFNRKTFKMILGVGAIEAGLLNVITFKTLALTLRSLDTVLKFIPFIRNYFLDKIVDKKANVERQFSKLILDFQEHINELNNKLVYMIDDKLSESISVYEVKAPVPSQCFRSICYQIEKTYQLLIDILPETNIKKLFIQVDDKFKTRLKNRLIQLKVSRDGGPQYAMIFQDMTFYQKQIKNLAYLSEISINFEDIWN